MDRIRELAWISVSRACGFVLLGIFTTMIALSFAPVMALKTGAAMFVIAAATLRLLAELAPGRNPRRTEVWCMLDPQDQPASAAAQKVISQILGDVYRRFSHWALAAGMACWVCGMTLSLVA